MSKIEFPLRIQLFPKTTKLTANEYIWALDMKRGSIFDNSKIAEEKVHGVSFHNHLVARCHIKNLWRGAVPNNALAMGGVAQAWGSSCSGIRIAIIHFYPLRAANSCKRCGQPARIFCTWFHRNRPGTELSRYESR